MSPAPFHIPVMVETVVAFLTATPPGPLVDATAGGGGHLAALAERTEATSADASGSRTLVGVDRDAEALEATRVRLDALGIHRDRVRLLHGDFRELPRLLADVAEARDGIAGLVADLGVSSHQLDAPDRGFSFRDPDAPLDMRMDPSRGPSAETFLGETDEDELAKLLREAGEVPRARRVARAVVAAARRGAMRTTGDLVRAVEEAGVRARRSGPHPATQVFQAVRIAVNGELDALDRLLADAPELLRPGGRLAVLSYHSLEDRRVKHALRRGERGPDRPGHLPPPPDWTPTWRVLTPRPERPDEAETSRNPRARSARLRVAERCEEEGTV